MAKEGRRRARLKAAKRNGSAKLPRSACKVCSKVWDFAMIDVKSEIQMDVCSDCKQKLAQGYTAFVVPSGFAFIKHESIKDLAGKIEPMSDENMEKVRKASEAMQKPSNSTGEVE